MILSHAHKFVFVCNGRTGTTSLEHALAPYDESGDLDFTVHGLWVGKHIPPAVLRALLPAALWDGYFVFAFVRHPLDWFVSQYRYNFGRPRLPAAVLARPWEMGAALRRYRRRTARHAVRVYDREDVDSLHRHLRRYRGLPGTPTLLQSSYVQDADGTRIVDFVGRFESLAEDVAAVQRRIGIEFTLPHLNRTEHAPYPECFTEAGARRVRELWAADFEALGYE